MGRASDSGDCSGSYNLTDIAYDRVPEGRSVVHGEFTIVRLHTGSRYAVCPTGDGYAGAVGHISAHQASTRHDVWSSLSRLSEEWADMDAAEREERCSPKLDGSGGGKE